MVTVSEYDNWQIYFQSRRSDVDKSDLYSAATIRAIFASQGARVSSKISDYLLDFGDSPVSEQAEPPQDSKSIWLDIFKITPE